MRFEAIRTVHPEVVTLRGDYDARDINNAAVVLDEPAIQIELDALILIEQEKELVKQIIRDVEAIEVVYQPLNDTLSYIFSGSESEQAKMATAIRVLEGKVDTTTRNFFTIDRVKVALTRDDFDSLLDMIEPIYETITDV